MFARLQACSGSYSDVRCVGVVVEAKLSAIMPFMSAINPKLHEKTCCSLLIINLPSLQYAIISMSMFFFLFFFVVFFYETLCIMQRTQE